MTSRVDVAADKTNRVLVARNLAISTRPVGLRNIVPVRENSTGLSAELQATSCILERSSPRLSCAPRQPQHERRR